jgi:hypothetical protein
MQVSEFRREFIAMNVVIDVDGTSVDLDAVDVMSDEWSGDINVVASALKQWFRELPEPLLTHGLYQGFIDAARKVEVLDPVECN